MSYSNEVNRQERICLHNLKSILTEWELNCLFFLHKIYITIISVILIAFKDYITYITHYSFWYTHCSHFYQCCISFCDPHLFPYLSGTIIWPLYVTFYILCGAVCVCVGGIYWCYFTKTTTVKM